MEAKNIENADREYRRAPIYWFAVLEFALKAQDFSTAFFAQRELSKLGVVVHHIGEEGHCREQ